jgi:predicted RNA methylase
MHTKGRPGDRSLTQQLEALDRLVASVRGKTVLDIGSAEGLISMHLIDKGAIAAHGVEIVPGHVEVANKLRKARACMFEVGDANTWAPQRQYDVVLMLAILHKLQDPSAACRRFARAARDLVVIRLPPYGSAIIDIRSGNVPHNIEAVMREEGWRLDEETRGPLNEWVGYFVRVSL